MVDRMPTNCEEIDWMGRITSKISEFRAVCKTVLPESQALTWIHVEPRIPHVKDQNLQHFCFDFYTY